MERGLVPAGAEAETGEALPEAPPAGRYRLAVLSLSHATIDCYGAFLAPIVALVLAPRLGLGTGTAAALLTLHVAALSIGQPLFGYLSDRLGGRWLVILAPALIGLSAGNFLNASSPALLVLAILGSAMAIAAFHPEGAALSGAVRPGRAAAGTAVFMAAGPLGQTGGPLLVTWAARQATVPAWLPWGGVAATLLLLTALPRGAVHRPKLGRAAGLRRALAGRWGLLGKLVTLSSTRYFVATGLTFLLPLLLLERLPRELAVARSGLWLSLFLGSSAVGGLLGSSRTRGGSRRRANIGSFALAAGLVALLPFTTGIAAVTAVVGAGAALGWTGPLVVTMGQRVAPQAAAMASALMLGAAWSLGGPLAPLLVELTRRRTSTAGAMALLAAVCLFAMVTAASLPAEVEQ